MSERETELGPFPGNYDRFPVVAVPGHGAEIGADRALHAVAKAAFAKNPVPVVAVECYPGVDVKRLKRDIARVLPMFVCIDAEEEAALDEAALNALLARHLTDDRVFGVMSHHRLPEFYDAGKLSALRRKIAERRAPTLVLGLGAMLALDAPDVLVLADMPRWELQQRLRKGLPNWRCTNGGEDVLRKYKRGFFIEWRVADRHKQTLFERLDFLLDSTNPDVLKLISADAFAQGLKTASRQPFRLAPFFDPGVWGGQWMKAACGLDASAVNYAWCFDCVPEENSLLLDVSGTVIEIPALDLVLRHPVELLGDRTHARFGREFPIRFDFLDTMGGGNLSLQVHPVTEYIQDRFGMPYTQDESYYILDAGSDACVYLGLKTGTTPARLESALREAQAGGSPFPDGDFVNRIAAKKHDHFLIPAGTIHCSGRNALVLEISATPYIFTFKLWDWGRTGLDGKPRPVHIEHGMNVVQWHRDTDWVHANLVNCIEPLGSGEGWREERTGLHAREFIETRRHWFTAPTPHDTWGTVNVLNLVEGTEAVVSSPDAAFAPFVVHYAETFVVPASVGPYVVSPSERSQGERLGTIKAFVRGTECRP